MPPITIEFYKPAIGANGDESFAEVLDDLINLKPGERIRKGDDPAGLFALERVHTKQEQYYFGEAARIRMDDLPQVVNRTTGAKRDLSITDAEGLSEETFFLYNVKLDVLALQKRLSFRSSTLRKLMSDLTPQTIAFHLILKQDAWKRFHDMTVIKKLTFKVARPKQHVGERNEAVLRVIDELDDFNAVSAKIEITSGRSKKRSLLLEKISSVVQDFNTRPEDYRMLRITGSEDKAQEDVEVVDFFKEALDFTDEVTKKGRRLDRESCRTALRRAIRENSNYLKKYAE
jgi:hypothetical protein